MSDDPKAPPKVTFAMLRDHRITSGLSDATVQLLADQLAPAVFEPGDTLITEGELASHLFIIMTGEIEVLTNGTQGTVRVALLGPGDWVGEMAILDVQPRSATVRSLAPSHLLKATGADVRRLVADRNLSEYAALVLNIARELSRRLRVADRLIANSGATMAREYVHLSMRPPAPPTPADD